MDDGGGQFYQILYTVVEFVSQVVYIFILFVLVRALKWAAFSACEPQTQTQTPGSLRTWQSCLDRIPWPSLPRSTSVEKVLIYTDGGCFFPRYSHLRLAFYASIIPGTSGDLGPRLASRFMPYGLSGGNHGGALGGTFIFETCCHS